jgi:hypothetical protein
MGKYAEIENFNTYSTQELFDYLQDNLLISPDEEFREWKHYKIDMQRIAEEFYEKYNNSVEL